MKLQEASDQFYQPLMTGLLSCRASPCPPWPCFCSDHTKGAKGCDERVWHPP